MKTKNWSIALVSSAIALVSAASPGLAETIEITANNVNVRSGAGINYGVITVWNQGVRGNRIKQEKNWSYVVTGPVEGWVSSLYVKPVTTSGGSQPSPVAYQAKGSIENARYNGGGEGELSTTGNRATMVIFSPARENSPGFSTLYYGTVYSSSENLIKVSLTEFQSNRTAGKIPTTGECQISLSNQKLRSANCRASGVDHGKTVFTAY